MVRALAFFSIPPAPGDHWLLRFESVIFGKILQNARHGVMPRTRPLIHAAPKHDGGARETATSPVIKTLVFYHEPDRDRSSHHESQGTARRPSWWNCWQASRARRALFSIPPAPDDHWLLRFESVIFRKRKRLCIGDRETSFHKLAPRDRAGSKRGEITPLCQSVRESLTFFNSDAQNPFATPLKSGVVSS